LRQCRAPCLGLGFVAIVGGDLVTLLRQMADDGAADAAGAAGNQCRTLDHVVDLLRGKAGAAESAIIAADCCKSVSARHGLPPLYSRSGDRTTAAMRHERGIEIG